MKKKKLNPRLREALLTAPLGIAIGLFTTTLELQGLVSYGGCLARWLLACGVAAGLLAATLGHRRGRFACYAVLLSLQLFYFLVAFSPLPELLVRGLPRTDVSAAPADAVFVFSSVLKPNGELGDLALSRLLHGLEVVADGRAPHLILSEQPAPNPSYVTAATRLMGRLGLPQRKILTVGPVMNSRDEAVQVARLFREKKWKTIIAITSPLHSRRACASLEHEGLTVICSPCIETKYDPELPVSTVDRLHALGDALRERLGIWLYQRRGWIASAG